MQTGELNLLWAETIMHELYLHGVRRICLSPGSRCTPLTVAAARHSGLETVTHFDERGMAFYALGQARALRVPVVLICTSGTAAANYLPAVVEASVDHVPLIVLTADRPPELRDTQANQTINQVGLFGTCTRWAFDLPCPTDDISLESVKSTVGQLFHSATGWPNGPAHLNCMYRKPLLPQTLPDTAPLAEGQAPFAQRLPIQVMADTEALKGVAMRLNATRGILVVGGLHAAEEREAVKALSNTLGWPVFADPASSLCQGTSNPHVIHYYHTLLQVPAFLEQLQVDTILQVGGRLVSNRLADFIRKSHAPVIRIQSHPDRDDPDALGGLAVVGSIARLCRELAEHIEPASPATSLSRFDAVAADTLPIAFDEPNCMRCLSSTLPEGGTLFLAASLAVRNYGQFADHTGSAITVFCNRGASGIDGTVASAYGTADASDKTTVLAIGDLALLHDLNSLALARSAKPLTIVVFNNSGGAIFGLLPIAKEKDLFEPYFRTPHAYTFEHAAAMFGLRYHHPESLPALTDALASAQDSDSSTLIEVTTGPDDVKSVEATWLRAISQALSE